MTSYKGKISQQSWMIAEETQRVMQALMEDGGDAKFVGGCVRNALANKPVLDIDIATPLKPDEVIDRLVRSKINYAPTGLKHGTVTAICEGKPFEITTLRKDVLTFGRHAEVAFTDSWMTDASRRDFTINAMFSNMEGDIDDYFGGIEDMRTGRVVFVGEPEKRIKEDILRILRFFRFYAYFGRGAPDRESLAACALLAREIPKLSPERIRQETLKTFEADRAAEVVRLMLVNGIITYFLPEATNVDALERLVDLETRYESRSFALRRMAGVVVTTDEGLPRLAQSLRLSNAQAQQIETMVVEHRSLSMNMPLGDARKLVYRFGNDMARSLLLLKAARGGEEGELGNLYAQATSFRPPVFPLEGADILSLGWKQGPNIGVILSEMEAWWMDQDFEPGRTACLRKLKEEYSALR